MDDPFREFTVVDDDDIQSISSNSDQSELGDITDREDPFSDAEELEQEFLTPPPQVRPADALV
jgi:hypothetical protein